MRGVLCTPRLYLYAQQVMLTLLFLSRISWSKNGFIAYSHYTSDTNVSITKLESIKGSSWRLAPTKKLAIRNTAPASSPLRLVTDVHWSTSGSDLAIIDDLGNITVLATGYAKSSVSNKSSSQLLSFEDAEIIFQDDVILSKNKQQQQQQQQQHLHIQPNHNNLSLISRDDYITKVIAFKWLNVDKPIISNSPAVKAVGNSSSGNNSGSGNNDTTYTYAVHQYRSHGTMHPIGGKTGFFTVRRDGLVELYYQDHTGSDFKKISLFLEDLQDHNSLWVKHASIGFGRDGSVVIVTYSPLINALRAYKVSIDWGINPNNNGNINVSNSSSTPIKVNPTMKLKKLVFETAQLIGENGLNLDIDRIDIVSPNFSLNTELEILLTLTGPGVLPKGNSAVLRKYHLSNDFKNLKFKTDSGYGDSVNITTTSVEGFTSLVLKDEIVLKHRILEINLKDFDFLIVLIFENGSIELRKTKDLKLIDRKANSNELPPTISSLLDSKFEFPLPESKPYSSVISPNLCGYVSLNYNQEMEYKLLSRPSHDLSANDILLIAASFGYKYSSACYTNKSSEDLIATIQFEISKIEKLADKENLIWAVLRESHRALNFSLDHSKDQIDRLLVNPPIQKLLSLQYSLGKFLPTTEVSSIALAILNLRLVAFSIMLTLRSLFHHQQRITKKGTESLADAIYRGESVLTILGTINWFIELLIFIIQELISLSNEAPANKDHYDTIALSLILSKIPRSLISYSIASIKRIDVFLSKIQQMANLSNPLINEILEKSCERYRSLFSVISLDNFEKFLSSIESLMPSENDKTSALEIEQLLVFQNKIPEKYIELVPSILKKFKECFFTEEGGDVSSLYFHDTNWLKLKIHKNKAPEKVLLSKDDPVPPLFDLHKTLIDDVTKTTIINKEKLKKCLRCEYITGLDHNGSFFITASASSWMGSNISHWPVAFNRTCICGSCWVYVDPQEVIS